MTKFLASAKHGLKRIWPTLAAGAAAVLASDSFRHYVTNHPQWAAFVPVIAWAIHAFSAQRKP